MAGGGGNVSNFLYLIRYIEKGRGRKRGLMGMEKYIYMEEFIEEREHANCVIVDNYREKGER